MTQKKATRPEVVAVAPSVFDDALKAEGIEPETGRREPRNTSTFVRGVAALGAKLSNIVTSGRTRTDRPNFSNPPRKA